MTYWEGPSRWINTVLLFIVGVVGLDTLFRLLSANEENAIVGGVRGVAAFFLAPFEGMFADQEYLLTAIIAVLGYSLLAGIALAIVRSIQASRRERAVRRVERVDRIEHTERSEPRTVSRTEPRAEPRAEPTRTTAVSPEDDDPERTRQL